MAFAQQDLDLVLVPAGLLLMFGYNLYFLYRYLHSPRKTVMGLENDDKRAWVEAVLLMKKIDDRSTGITVITSSISAATFFASVCLTLCSILGAWMANSSSSAIFSGVIVLGDTKPSTIIIKHLCLLLCFLVAFSCFVQSARLYVHASYLLTSPEGFVDVQDVIVVVIRAGEFWSLGHRSLYFALNLLLWFFGPVPMVVSSVALVVILHHHDMYSIPLKRRPVRKKGQSGNGVQGQETATARVE